MPAVNRILTENVYLLFEQEYYICVWEMFYSYLMTLLYLYIIYKSHNAGVILIHNSIQDVVTLLEIVSGIKKVSIPVQIAL